jgi:hypothetical protein
MRSDIQEFLEGLAVIVWGVVAIVLLFLLAFHLGSVTAMALTALAAGVTYLFQELQRHFPESRVINILGVLPVFLFLAGLIAATLGA